MNVKLNGLSNLNLLAYTEAADNSDSFEAMYAYAFKENMLAPGLQCLSSIHEQISNSRFNIYTDYYKPDSISKEIYLITMSSSIEPNSFSSALVWRDMLIKAEASIKKYPDFEYFTVDSAFDNKGENKLIKLQGVLVEQILKGSGYWDTSCIDFAVRLLNFNPNNSQNLMRNLIAAKLYVCLNILEIKNYSIVSVIKESSRLANEIFQAGNLSVLKEYN